MGAGILEDKDKATPGVTISFHVCSSIATKLTWAFPSARYSGQWVEGWG